MKRSGLVSELAHVSLGALLLVAAGSAIGHFAIFSDTFGYLRQGEYFATRLHLSHGIGLPSSGTHSYALTPDALARFGPLVTTIAASRSPFYGLPLFLVSAACSPWAVAYLQALAAAWMVLTVCRVCAPDRGTAAYWTAILVLGAGSTLPFFVNFIMPDVFAGVAILGVALMIGAADRLSRAQTIGIWALVTMSASFHRSHAVLVLALTLLGVVSMLTRRAGLKVIAVRAAPLLAALVIVVLGDWAAGAIYAKDTGYEQRRPPFLMARVLADGYGKDYLDAVCPGGPAPTLCRFKDQPFAKEEDILWFPFFFRGVFGSADYVTRLKLQKEEIPFVLGAIRHEPRRALTTALRNWSQQLTSFMAVDPMIDPTNFKTYLWRDDPALDLLLPGAAPCWDRFGCAAIRTSDVVVVAFLIDAFVLCISLATLVALTILRLFASASDETDANTTGVMTCITFLVIMGVVSNAAVCGILSGPFNRYGARVIWLVPFITILNSFAFGRLRRSRPIPRSLATDVVTRYLHASDNTERARLLRFLVVGGTATVAYTLTAAVLCALWPQHRHMIAVTVYMALVPPTFLAQKRLTFRSAGGIQREFLGYVMIQACSVAFTSLWLPNWLTTNVFWNIVVFAANACCSAAVTFALCRLLVFRRRHECPDDLKLAAEGHA